MRTATTLVRRTPEACWRVLVDATLAPGWVPGLRRATVIARDAEGRPAEVHFEFAESFTYTLVYTYGDRELTFEPRLGKRDGVRGFARIERDGEHARLVYGLEPGNARRPGDDDVDALVAAFAQWMHGYGR